MRRISIIILLFSMVAALFTSCNDYLDINENPNKATAAGADLVLPQALAATALVLNEYNTYGMNIGGYGANAGGYGGFNELVSYAYTPNNYGNLWSTTYDNLEDYQYIIDQTKSDSTNLYLYAVAKIMKAYDFQLLIDTYNDVPYSQALHGEKFLTPVYDKADKIYDSLAIGLDEAIAAIKKGDGFIIKPNSITASDIVFGGDMSSWIKLANTIKLRLIIRGNNKVTFTNKAFSDEGFLEDDAIINPGYTKDNSRQNPKWNRYAFGYTNSAGLKSWIPTTYVMGFYDGTKLRDPGRGAAMYYEFTEVGGTGTNQLGFEGNSIPKSPDGSFWYPASDRKVVPDTTGVLKNPSAGFPLFTAAESYLLQAEGGLGNLIVADPKAMLDSGMRASFNYLYEFADGTIDEDPYDLVSQYKTLNAGNYLVDFDAATTIDKKLEAIITQKYIALNMVNSQEGWNEYRRTGYPESSGLSPSTSFASKTSQSTRADKLPTRILYPTSEVQFNGANVPSASTNTFTSLIFWAK